MDLMAKLTLSPGKADRTISFDVDPSWCAAISTHAQQIVAVQKMAERSLTSEPYRSILTAGIFCVKSLPAPAAARAFTDFPFASIT